MKNNFFNNNGVLIVASSINDALEQAMPRIRPRSQCFYRKNIAEELSKYGETLVDVHAGCGIHFKIILDEVKDA
ncbi:hypothetical protein LO80_03415 [Candidatus Francisella endociliophora]|uniref:Uncharacterized protein n=1 Tax=Candidatus Francisella endociliophora TaxID=653937 RepID=A0A097ENG5_9GAMM|nr:hypothetical protein [Francisella sp. FSC1006]AIT09108.1 hypothetical protein LO80_03415 [Francisella sp. FSC1006]